MHNYDSNYDSDIPQSNFDSFNWFPIEDLNVNI